MTRVLRVNVVGALLLTGLFLRAAPPSLMVDAAARGDLETVRALIQEGADVNAAHGDGMTALHWAADRGDAAMVGVLIAGRARVNRETRIGSYTPLHLAAQGGHELVVKALLDAGADANAAISPDASGGVTPLHLAAMSGDRGSITALVDHGADVDATERQWGHTPLMFAAERNRADAIRVLLGRGADPEARGRAIDVGQRAVEDSRAAARRNEKVLGMAPRGGGYQPAVSAEEQLPDSIAGIAKSVPEQVGIYGGMSALTLAARNGHRAAVEALLEGGADINGVSGDHTSPLLIACINGFFDLGMTLLARGADPNLAAASGDNPLFAVVNRQWFPDAKYPGPTAHLDQEATYLEFLEALLEAGANPNARLTHSVWHVEMGDDMMRLDWTGATPLMRAAYAADLTAMKLLVRFGADPRIPIRTPIRRQLPYGFSEARGVLEDPTGLPPLAPGSPGVHAIHLASGYGYAEDFVANGHRHVPNGFLPAVKYLVEEWDADVNIRDFRGNTALHNAASRGDNELILYLVSKGGDVTVIDRLGRTTVDMANAPLERVEPYPQTIQLLESLGAKNSNRCLTC